MKRILAGVLLSNMISCATTSEYHLDNVWYKQGITEAFKESKSTGKPTFIYWGAVWCPPCNEIKDQVFSKPRFGKIMENYIPVYLDGDTEEAQIWADKLQAFGYPTILVFSPEGKELVRISSGVNLEEFELALAGARNNSVEDLLKKSKSGKLDDSGWKSLAYTSWGQLPQNRYSAKKKWEIQRYLVAEVPRDLVEESSALSSSFISSTIALAKDDQDTSVKNVKLNASRLLDLIFKNERSIKASRGFITSQGVDTLEWAFSDNKVLFEKWKNRWLDAAKKVRRSHYSSVDTKLWASYPELQFFRYENPKKEVPKSLKKKIVDAALEAEKNATSKYERHSVISGAAYLLRQVKAFNEAEIMLKNEVSKTDTPWYYQSSLSALASEQNKDKEALFWSSKARQSAQGRATKLQWITNDLLLTAKVKSDDQEERLLNLVNEYYQLATGLNDGFAGRNHFRAARVSKSLQSWKSKAEFKALLKKYQIKCSSLKTERRSSCEKHFEELL